MSTEPNFENLPDGWRLDTLGGLFEVQQGKALSPEARGGVSRRPFLRTRNVLWGRLDLADVDTMSFDESEASRLTLQDRDLLVCEGGEIGRTAIWGDELPGCLYQNHIHRLRRKTDEVDPLFVMYWLQAAFLKLGLYEGIENKTTIPNLSGARLKVLPVPVPGVREQGAIADVMTTLQAAVQVELNRVTALKELKVSTMRKLFHEGLRGEQTRVTELGEVPESWAIAPLGKVCRIQSGGTPARDEPQYWGGGIPWVRTGEINYKTITRTEETITAAGLAASSARIFPAGTLLMAMYGQGVTRGKVARLGIEAATNQACAAFFPDEGLLTTEFLYAYFSHSYERLREAGHGANQKNLSADLLKGILVPIPADLAEQRVIFGVLDCLERASDAAEDRVRSLEALFASTLHLVMTGELRVVPAAGRNEAPNE